MSKTYEAGHIRGPGRDRDHERALLLDFEVRTLRSLVAKLQSRVEALERGVK